MKLGDGTSTFPSAIRGAFMIELFMVPILRGGIARRHPTRRWHAITPKPRCYRYLRLELGLEVVRWQHNVHRGGDFITEKGLELRRQVGGL